MKSTILVATGALLSGAASALPAHAQNAPVETRPANAPDQQPARADQTRAPQPETSPEIAAERTPIRGRAAC
jgi:aldose sugar dehydrogenase